MTAKAGVVGWPIAHSLSPVLHGHWLKEYGIDGSYERIAIEPGSFPQRIAELRAAGFRGVNVTVPYKEEAFALAHTSSEDAQVAGAANLLVFTPDNLVAAGNTDGTGLIDSLEQAIGVASLGGKNIVMLGAGGAARGAIYALYRLGAKVTVLNRHPERAAQLVQQAKASKPDGNFRAGTFEDWPEVAKYASLVINTTSAGMKGNPPLALDLSPLPKEAKVCDIVYNPLETDLLKRAAARGHQTIDGLGMLMHQAAPSFEAFFGVKPRVTPALRDALIEALNAR